jgi:hypothetical protein
MGGKGGKVGGMSLLEQIQAGKKLKKGKIKVRTHPNHPCL